MNVSAFRPRVSSASATGRNWWPNLRLRMDEALGRWLNRHTVPGAVQPMTYRDELTGQSVEVAVSALYTVLTINGRDYYFRRLSGRFDGTGQSLIL